MIRFAASLVSALTHAESFAIEPDGSFSYVPASDYHGPDSFTYKANDGTGDSNATTVTVNQVNDAPTVSVLDGSDSQSSCLSDAAGWITLELRDVDDGAGALTLTASSFNTRLVANREVAFSGSGGARAATITTLSGRTGASTVTLTVGDGRAGGNVRVTVHAAANGNETLEGTGGPDLLLGQNGDDAAYGREGSDVLCGANGDDRLSGGGGADSFDGGAGTDNATDFDAGQGDARKNIP